MMEQQDAMGMAESGWQPPMDAGGQAQTEELDPKKKQQLDQYSSVLMQLIHGKDYRDSVIELLDSVEDPTVSLPNAAMAINDQAVSMIGKVPVDIQLSAGAGLVSDLVEVGQAALGWQVTNDEIKMAYQDTVQDYMTKGIKDGSVDPIELQGDVEPLMSDEQRAAGNMAAKREGLGQEVNPHAGIAQLKKAGGSNG